MVEANDESIYGYNPNGFKVKSINVGVDATVQKIEPVYSFGTTDDENLVKSMFLMIPNLCYKFNAMLASSDSVIPNEYVYKNHGVTYSDYDVIEK